MLSIRYVQEEDKDFWFKLDKHLPQGEFEKKIRDKMGYKDSGALVMNVPNYKQPMEMFFIKVI